MQCPIFHAWMEDAPAARLTVRMHEESVRTSPSGCQQRHTHANRRARFEELHRERMDVGEEFPREDDFQGVLGLDVKATLTSEARDEPRAILDPG
jgi:hypothetical protein